MNTANWRTTITGGLQSLLMAVVTGAIVFPTNWHDPKQVALFGCVIVGTFFGVSFAATAKDKQVTGGTVQQTASGAVVKDGGQSLVDETIKGSIHSGEEVTAEQRKAVGAPPAFKTNVNVLIAALLLPACLFFTSCTTSKDAAGNTTTTLSPTGEAAIQAATQIATVAATAAIQSYIVAPTHGKRQSFVKATVTEQAATEKKIKVKVDLPDAEIHLIVTREFSKAAKKL
jgi:hypothetical protein